MNSNIENEKLQIKVRYLEEMLSNVTQFEKTNQIFDLKQFVSVNYKRFCLLIDERQMLAQQLEQERNRKDHYEPLQTTSRQAEEQIQNLELTVKQLSNEIEELSQMNIRQREMLQKKDFFREYEFMVKETEGLRQQNMKLMEQINQKNN